MTDDAFAVLLTDEAGVFIRAAIRAALDEDGPDLTSQALFAPDETLDAVIVAKQDGTLAGLGLIELTLMELAPGGGWRVALHAVDGQRIIDGSMVAELHGPAVTLLRAERVALNLICHLSGVATLTAAFAARLQDSPTQLLDTRKTLPGLRHLQKYAVRMGGGMNHRFGLGDMLMLKDNHIDRAGSITGAVEALRVVYSPCPPIEVECRNLDDVREAAGSRVERIMLDNMDHATMRRALELIPEGIESEISGGVTLETIAEIGRIGADFVSVGALTHSAPALDLSMRINDPHGPERSL